MTPKKVSILATALVSTLLLAGCAGTGATTPAASAQKSDSLTVGVATAPVSLDPSKAANGSPNRWFEDPSYAPLIKIDADGKLVPGLASKWGYIGTDNNKFEFTLRPGLKFADGTPLTSKEVIDSFKYFQEKGTGPTRAYFLGMTFEADAPDHVVITSAAPNPMIDFLLTPNYYAGSPISPAGITNPQQLAAKTFGAGQYTLDTAQTVAGDHYVYTKNENYYDPSEIHYSKITVKVIPNVTQQVQALKTGQIDAMSGDSSVGGTATGADLQQINHANTWRGLYLLDRDGTVVPALKSVDVRKALNMAVDRAAVTKAAYGEFGKAVGQPTPLGTADYGYDEALNSTYSYDPDKAKKMLADAGYPNGFTLPVNYQSFNAADTKMIQAAASQLEKIGVTLELKPAANFGEWVNDLVSKRFGATVLGAGGPLYLSAQFGFMPKGVLNPFGVSDAGVIPAFNALAAAPQDKVGDAAKALSKVLVDEAIALPIAQVDAIFMFNKKKVNGIRFLGESGEVTPITSWSSQ